MDDEAFWSSDPKVLEDSEWTKISSEFTNAGYREGITAGKESALQQGFDEGFAQATLVEVRGIATQLAGVRFSDIAPPDLEALAHAREHLESAMDEDEDAGDLADPAKLNEEIKEKRDMEGLEDLMAQMNAGSADSGGAVPTRPKAEDVARLKGRLLAVAQGLALDLQWS
ncbi:hypothetical protein BD413DRAFT_605884 [Trametes elegans]|nr:hypothetical protein BD413DRAFT_605884 [Trametes elegans]